jgi:hypothetical protein
VIDDQAAAGVIMWCSSVIFSTGGQAEHASLTQSTLLQLCRSIERPLAAAIISAISSPAFPKLDSVSNASTRRGTPNIRHLLQHCDRAAENFPVFTSFYKSGANKLGSFLRKPGERATAHSMQEAH